MNDWRKIGRQFTLGVFDAMAYLIVFLIIGFVVTAYFTPVDDCDKDWWNRCGFKIQTDNKTGKQYLVTSGGGIIERAVK